MIDSFGQRLQILDDTISPLHEKSTRLQRKQQNVTKLLKTIDATIQLYGRTAELENAIRDTNPSHDLQEYIDNMDALNNAILFFASHPTYDNQRDNMKLTFESGCACLEKEFRTLVVTSSIMVAPTSLIECLDEEYGMLEMEDSVDDPSWIPEILSARIRSLETLKNVKAISSLFGWLQRNGDAGRCIETYAVVRSENMLKTLHALGEQQREANLLNTSASNSRKASSASSRSSSTVFFKQAFKKATGRASDRFAEKRELLSDGTLDFVMLLFASVLALIQIESELAAKISGEVTMQAQLQRHIVSRPLRYVVNTALTIVGQYDQGVSGMLAAVKFLLRHNSQLLSLSQNAVSGHIPFESLMQLTSAKMKQSIGEICERLTLDNDKFYPKDGNVHQVTANTMQLLNHVANYRNTVTVTTGSAELVLEQILGALDGSVHTKSLLYQDEWLQAIFLLNNTNYILNGIQVGAVANVLRVRLNDLVHGYRQKMTELLERYLRSWNRVLSVFSMNLDDGDRTAAAKSIFSAKPGGAPLRPALLQVLRVLQQPGEAHQVHSGVLGDVRRTTLRRIRVVPSHSSCPIAGTCLYALKCASPISLMLFDDSFSQRIKTQVAELARHLKRVKLALRNQKKATEEGRTHRRVSSLG
uniref:Exocyst complex component 7 n=1 Tax=Steinernema glaseri TaxID=37863 RepID=A0A1I7YHX7_9BILA